MAKYGEKIDVSLTVVLDFLDAQNIDMPRVRFLHNGAAYVAIWRIQ